MVKVKVREFEYNRRETTFINTKCGHEQIFDYCAPPRCKHENCNVEIPAVNKLIGAYNLDLRVKYHVEGKI